MAVKVIDLLMQLITVSVETERIAQTMKGVHDASGLEGYWPQGGGCPLSHWGRGQGGGLGNRAMNLGNLNNKQ